MSDRTIVYTLALITVIGLTGYLFSIDNAAASTGLLVVGFFMALILLEHLHR